MGRCPSMLGFAETSLRMGGHQMRALSTCIDVSSERTRKVGPEGYAPEGLKLNLEWNSSHRSSSWLSNSHSIIALGTATDALDEVLEPRQRCERRYEGKKAHTYTCTRTCAENLHPRARGGNQQCKDRTYDDAR